jgi:hypothetical protein
MQGTQIHDGKFFTILWDAASHIIGIKWKESTAEMSDEDFKAALTTFAGYVEQTAGARHPRRCRAVPASAESGSATVARAEHFDAVCSRGRQAVRIPLSSRRATPPMMNQSSPGESFETRGFDDPVKAMTWLAGAD